MEKTSNNSKSSDSSFISLSLKPKIDWFHLLQGVFLLAIGLSGVVVLVIIWLFNTLIRLKLLPSASGIEIDFWVVIIPLFTLCWVINEITQTRKFVWLTKNVQKDIDTKDVIILKPISKSDLAKASSTK
ncbi:MAG: hypothetical protein V1767_04720 [Chloroflexota bacterium]